MDAFDLPKHLSCQQIRSVDRYAINNLGIDGLLLMENAARGCVDLIQRQGVAGAVAVVCGKGNNGGDGLAMVRQFLTRGIPAKALLLADPKELQGDAKSNYEILEKIDSKSIQLPTESDLSDLLESVGEVPTDWIVDAILGTGTKGKVAGYYGLAIDAINSKSKKIFSVDIPSGMNGDTGESLGSAIRAQLTGTFVASKNGFQNESAAEYLGEVVVLDIGIPSSVVQRSLGQGVI